MVGKYYIVQTQHNQFICVIKFGDNTAGRLKKYIIEKFPKLKEEIIEMEKYLGGEYIEIKPQPKNYLSKYKICISGLNLLLNEIEIIEIVE